MSNINKAAVLNPFTDLTANILNYVPRATTSEFGIVAIGSGINVDVLGRIYLDTQEYSDRLTAIEAQAASSLTTQQTEVAAAIAQVNLTQSQTITALTLEVNNLKTNLTDSITATQTDLINRADQLAQNVTDITDQLALDKAAFTQEIQDALVYLENQSSTASALRTPRKIQSVDFDGTQDINLPVFNTQIDGLVPKRVGATTTKYLREDGTWEVPPDTTYPLLTQANAEAGTATTANTISAQVLKEAIQYHAPTVTNIVGNAATATKLQTPRTINGVLFDGTQNISLPEAVAYSLPTASASILGGIKVGSGLTISNSVLSVGTLNQSTTGNAATATKLQTARTISLTGKVTGSVSFDGSANASITTAITGLGAANGIATLDSNGQVPSTQLPSYVDDVLEYLSVAAFPTTGVTGKIYVEIAGNTTYRWSGSRYVKIASGDVSSVAGKTGVVTLTKADVGLANVDNTPDAQKPISTATQLALNDTVKKADVIDITKGGTGATTVEGAKQSLGLQRFTLDEYVTSIYAPPTPEGESRLVVTKTGWGVWSTNPNFDNTLSMHYGGTGASTAAEARANLGLGTAATKNVGTGVDDVMRVGEYGIGGTLSSLDNIDIDTTGSNPDLRTGVYEAYDIIGSFVALNGVHGTMLIGGSTYSSDPPQYAYYNSHSGNKQLRVSAVHTFRTTQNTWVDGNGFIKAASPVVELYANEIKLNNEAKDQDIVFEKGDVGSYLLKGTTGLAQDGWYIEQPKDSNGNIFHAVEYGTHNNGDIWIKTYEQIMDGTRIVADHTKPVDIKENRFITIRLNELPKDTTAPINPTVKDNEGNPAPSRLHELEEGVWVISDENAAILEQERLSAMKPLKRRQFRLALAMNGYDLKEIETLIDQIADPMQRTIAQIEWQDATDFERTNPTLLMVAELLQLTSEQIDQLWNYGLAL